MMFNPYTAVLGPMIGLYEHICIRGELQPVICTCHPEAMSCLDYALILSPDYAFILP